MANVDDMCFHGVTFTDWEYSNGMTELELLETVLNDGYILTRSSLEIKHPYMYRSLAYDNLNDNDRVSICCHSVKEKDYTYDSLDGMYFNDSYSAFEKFVNNAFSVILDRDVLEEYRHQRSGMIGEYQVYGDVSLEYIKALGMPNYFERMCNRIQEILEEDDYLDYRYDLNVQRLKLAKDMIRFLTVGYNGYGYNEYNQLKGLLNKYNYDVPIVDPVTGSEWLSKEEMGQKIDNLKELAMSRRLIKI